VNDENTSRDRLASMNEAAKQAAQDFERFPEETKNLFATWMKRWYLKAGYKRLCKIMMKYPDTNVKSSYQRIQQLHFLFERIKLTREGRLAQYLKEIKQYPILTKDEELRLAKRVRKDNNEKALEIFICSNLRMVVTIARKFQGDRLSLLDLINAGNEGLIHAAQKFDERKGVRFYWYAQWWIKRAIYDALSTGRSIIPKSHIASVVQHKITESIVKKGHEPTDQELAIALKVDEQKIKAVRAELMPTYSLDELYSHMDRDLPEESLEHFMRSEYVALEHDDHLFVPSLEKQRIKQLRREAFEIALNRLNDREREILMRRFGIGEYEPHSLQDIASIFNLSRERIRQLKENALGKFKIIYRNLLRKT
jgi:RNA polymerase primary sigma factor